ncbi:PucR family transcriptional regulator ligand-binding domain-containing protein [Streptomyces rameus]|uniref:PucR family transcriptional regulator ligand-binding domain-containing protein n=1 Tax=Streptomyces rameus TaxID=68261 RepID=A0ABP6NAM3_9ACTN
MTAKELSSGSSAEVDQAPQVRLLEDPARFVRPDEVVLSGLVWWSADGGRKKAERFVAGLKDAGAAALLAGEETHGSVPEDLVEACVRHGVPVAGVPAHVMFRAITDAVYLRQWGGLSRHHALPEHVRVRLNRLAAQDPDPALILATAFAHLDAGPAYVLTPAGRTVAATPGAGPLQAREAALTGGDSGTTVLTRSDSGATVPVEGDPASPYERWWLHLPDGAAAPPRPLHEIAAFLGRCQETLTRRRSLHRRAADGLGRLLTDPGAGPGTDPGAGPGTDPDGGSGTGPDAGDLTTAVQLCGLPTRGPYRVIVADTGARHRGLADGALTEMIAHTSPAFSAVGRLPDGTAFAVVPEDATTDLVEIWPLVAGCEPDVFLHGGLAAPAAGTTGLPGALAEARYALSCARETQPGNAPLIDATDITTLDTLLTGIPAEVRTAYSRTVLGPLFDSASASAAALLNTLEVFLAHDGSWTRTAEELHLHVNTVHYRIQRIEHFTGLDLSRLRDRLDVWAALLCRTDPHRTPAPTTARPPRSSTSPARRP